VPPPPNEIRNGLRVMINQKFPERQVSIEYLECGLHNSASGGSSSISSTINLPLSSRAKKMVRPKRTIFVVEGPAFWAEESRSLDCALRSVKPIAMLRSG
jgi:hypothetical protein